MTIMQKLELPRKPYYVKVTDDCDFFELFKKIEKRFDTCFILESLGEDSHIARHTIIGFDPEKIIHANGSKLTITERDGSSETTHCDNPYQTLRSIMPQNIISTI